MKNLREKAKAILEVGGTIKIKLDEKLFLIINSDGTSMVYDGKETKKPTVVWTSQDDRILVDKSLYRIRGVQVL